jgi:hypothetical protein
MTYSEPARTTAHRIPGIVVAGLLVVFAAVAAARHRTGVNTITAHGEIDE